NAFLGIVTKKHAVRNIAREPHSRLERQVLRSPARFLDRLHRQRCAREDFRGPATGAWKQVFAGGDLVADSKLQGIARRNELAAQEISHTRLPWHRVESLTGARHRRDPAKDLRPPNCTSVGHDDDI